MSAEALRCTYQRPSARQVSAQHKGMGHPFCCSALASLLSPHPSAMLLQDSLHMGQAALHTLKGYRDDDVNYYNAELSGKVTRLNDSRSLCKGGFRDEKTEAEKLLSQGNFAEPWSQMA